jgi:hypothetical protein
MRCFVMESQNQMLHCLIEELFFGILFVNRANVERPQLAAMHSAQLCIAVICNLRDARNY